MKIAFFIGGLNIKGGYERIIVDKANALCKQKDIEVEIVCTHTNYDNNTVFKIDPRINIRSINQKFHPVKRLYGLGLPIIAIQYFLWLRRHTKACRKVVIDNKYDIVVVPMHDPTNLIGIKNCVSVYESHFLRTAYENNCLIPWFRRRKNVKYASKADVFVCLTQKDAQNWPEAHNLRIIPNFTNARPITPYNPDIKRVVAIGRLEHEKGFDILINAWNIVKRTYPDWNLDIYGEGNEYLKLQNLIDSIGLTYSITLKGNTDNVPKVLSDASILVSSSRNESFGLTLIEAFSCGVPVVSFDCPYGPSEIIMNGLNGLLAKYENLSDKQRSETLAISLMTLIEDINLRKKMSVEAIKRASDFSKESYLESQIPFIKSIMKDNR